MQYTGGSRHQVFKSRLFNEMCYYPYFTNAHYRRVGTVVKVNGPNFCYYFLVVARLGETDKVVVYFHYLALFRGLRRVFLNEFPMIMNHSRKVVSFPREYGLDLFIDGTFLVDYSPTFCSPCFFVVVLVSVSTEIYESVRGGDVAK